MLYPRKDKFTGKLVDDSQMVGYKEHLTQKHRVLFIQGTIGVRCGVCGASEYESHNLLMALDSLSHDPIKLFITSPGGDLDSTFMFYDTMKLIQSPIITVGRFCASAASLLLAAGTKRYLFPHAKVMLHLPSAEFPFSDAKDMAIRMREMTLYQDKILDILISGGVKKSKEEILHDIDRAFWMSPKEAIAYGLADEILTKEQLGEWLK